MHSLPPSLAVLKKSFQPPLTITRPPTITVGRVLYEAFRMVQSSPTERGWENG